MLSSQLELLQTQHPSATRASRSDAIYGTHAYHTKVPPKVAAAYIARHCPTGGTVLDPFCGSGMTGVGARMVGRHARLSDLSPAAVHIARNYTVECDPGAFDAAVRRVLQRVGDEIAEMYRSSIGQEPATVEHVVWSDVRACPGCAAEVLLWDVRERGLRHIECPRCSSVAAKSKYRYIGERPVQTALSTPGSRKRLVRAAEPGDTRAVVPIPPSRWYPTDPFDRSRPMWRKSHEDMGITSVDRFFSERNLAALTALWATASEERDDRLRSMLRFSLTAIVNRASRRYQWNAKRPTNVLGGTLYVSSLRYEWNVLSLWRRKVAAVRKLLVEKGPADTTVAVARESATRLSLADASIDYCFCDPPFGAHIVYSDASLLWEAWLGELTPRDDEAIVVSGGNRPKDVGTYRSMLTDAFAEVRRVLKAEARATVVFQATDPEVWEAIMTAADEVGLVVIEASTLHKGQPSFKQIKGTLEGERVAHTDVVLTFAKTTKTPRASDPVDPRGVIAAELRAAEAAGAPVNIGHIYAVVAAALLAGGSQPLPFDAVAALVRESQEAGVAVR